MKYINFNEDDFIDWLSSKKGVFFLEISELKDLLSEYKQYVKNIGKITLTEIKEMVDSVSLAYEFKDIPKKYAKTQLIFICFTLSKKHTTTSLKEIAIYFDRKNHGTILNGISRFNERKDLGDYKEFKEVYDICNNYLIEKRKDLSKKEL